jgi:chromosome segregation protein
MFLKRLDIFGFKSFADKTVMDFTNGVTALVGPNGCGKSNVVDAIRWALGEQSAKSLRGSEMTDLIFNGTSNRRPMGFAQVSLVFNNSARHLPIDAEEVAITRRLYRDGESQYLINGQLSRLRDIREMFMDTGVGVGAYSIIEQGKIAAFLDAKPIERRAIFEEAAGIAKYRNRKATALRKLDRVNQNQQRVGDVIIEIERQLRSVVRQARKARRHKVLQEELSRIQVTVWASDFTDYSARLADVGNDCSSAEDTVVALSAQSGRLEATLIEAQAAAIELDKAAQNANQRRIEDSKRLSELESGIRHAEELASQNREQANLTRADAREISARATKAQEDQRQAQQEQKIVSAEIESVSAKIQGQDRQHQQTSNRTSELAQALERGKSNQVEVVREHSGVEQQLTALLAEQKHLNQDLSRLEQAASTFQERQDNVNRECLHSNSRISEVTQRKEAVTEELETGRKLEQQLLAGTEALALESTEATALLSGRESRLHTLNEQEARQEGLNRGVKGVLSAIKSGQAPEGICGIVADLVKVPEKLELAIETALGNKVQNVVTTDAGVAKGTIELLKRDQLGRATFLPLDRLRSTRNRITEQTLSRPGVLGRASELVAFDPEFRPVFDYLLGATLVVTDLDTAVAISADSDNQALIVTLDGEIIYPSGAMTGGAFKTRFAGIISRKNEISRLENDINDTQADLCDLALARTEISREMTEARETNQKLHGEFNSLEASITQMRGSLEKTTRELQHLSDELAVITHEQHQKQQRGTTIDSELRAAIQRGEILVRQEESLKQEISQLATQLEEMRNQRTELAATLTNTRIEFGELNEKLSGLNSRLSDAARLLAERNQEIQTRLAAAEESEKAAEQQTLRAEKLREEISEAAEAAARAEQQDTEVARNRSEVREEIVAAQNQERSLKAELDRSKDLVNDLKLRQQKAQLELEALNARAAEAGEDHLSARAAELQGATIDLEALRSQMTEAQDKLLRMGEVNLSAISEEDELRARLENLGTQKADLDDSHKKLREAIAYVNRISRQRFNETFELVRTNFQETYRKLFGGGKADIHLEEGVDVLESGIEIMARPPGKELQKMSLLSGGERTLTTIALLFAVFKAKPSPFCVLDEVDAPLDESNIDRFMMVLREFLDRSQFLIITHNRRTMATADMIYGVTMQESGVSKQIAVRFEDVDDDDLAVA